MTEGLPKKRNKVLCLSLCSVVVRRGWRVHSTGFIIDINLAMPYFCLFLFKFWLKGLTRHKIMKIVTESSVTINPVRTLVFLYQTLFLHQRDFFVAPSNLPICTINIVTKANIYCTLTMWQALYWVLYINLLI